MSGPKTSRYTLTPEQSRLLAEQRRMEQRKAVASRNIQKDSRRLLQISGMFSAEKQVAGELNNRGENDGGFLQKFNELETLITSATPLVERADKEDVSSLERESEFIRECVVKAEKKVRELSEIAAQNEKNLQAQLDAAIDRGFSTSFADIKSNAQASVDDTKDKIQEQLLQLKKNYGLPAKLIEEIKNAISRMNEIHDEVFLKNFSAVTVLPLIKKCKRFLSEYEECYKEFEKMYSEYAALCELYCYAAQEYPCDTVSIETLKAEIQRMKEKAAEENEQAYISECLDEVMEEMGYIVLGRREVTKKSGKHFQSKLYTYDEGTAVNVTCSSDGRVAMELGGIDGEDRIPDDREAVMLCDSMERFCDDFKEIEKRLFAKGVVLADRISMLPPNAEYAQIINASDYKMKGEAEKFKVKRQRKATTKLKLRSETNGKV